MRATVVGAGVAGLSCACDLAAAGWEVVVLDKGRRVGGRTSTRRVDGEAFDHGAPWLPPGTPGDHGVRGDLPLVPYADGLVPEGSMRALCLALADGLDVRCSTLVEDLAALDGDVVVVTAPAPQAAALLDAVGPALAGRAREVAWNPCWVVMAAWDEPPPPAFPVAVARAVREAGKPGRAPGERWVLHASAAWSAAREEDDPDAVCDALLDGLPTARLAVAHRWRYAVPRTPLAEPFLRDGRYAVAGDWCGGRDVAAARRSGRALAAALIS